MRITVASGVEEDKPIVRVDGDASDSPENVALAYKKVKEELRKEESDANNR